jgi:phage gp29-like protein
LKETTDYGGMHGPSPILGPDGAPLPRRRELTQEIAAPTLAGVRAFSSEIVASGLTPERLAAILRQANDGDHRAYLQLAEDMEERDLHYAAVLGVRKRALSGIRPVVEPPDGDPPDDRVMDAVRALARAPAFRRLVSDLLDGLAKGYSVVEIMWEERGGMWTPAEYRHRNPAWFTFDKISRTTLRLAEDASIDGAEMPPAKFIRHVPQLKTGSPVRGGLARLAAWGFLFKSFSLKSWAQFVDVYGMPLRVGKYHPGATADERRSLLRAVTQIASDAGAVIPESMAIEFIETRGVGEAPFEALGRYCDEQLSKAILGQTMTSDNGSSRAQADVHNKIRLELLEDDAEQLAATVNRDLIAWFVALNFGADAPRPAVAFPVQKPEDVLAMSQALERLVPLGLKVRQNEVRERLGFSAPEPDDEVLGRAATAPATDEGAPRVGLQRFFCENTALNRQAPDFDIDEIARDGAQEWRSAMSPLIEQVRDAATAASSFDEFLAALDRLTPDMSALERELFVAHMKARGLADE